MISNSPRARITSALGSQSDNLSWVRVLMKNLYKFIQAVSLAQAPQLTRVFIDNIDYLPATYKRDSGTEILSSNFQITFK